MDEALSIENSILVDFECPICRNYMFPPIRQCTNGHSCCNKCFTKIRVCSQCRSLKSNSRCYTLEKIHSKLTFPCKYQEEGCIVGAKGMLIKNHENFCEYTKKQCPLKSTENCEWCDKKKEFIAHALEKHPSKIFFESKQQLQCENFIQFSADRQYCALFSVFNEMFRLTWDLNEETGSMRFAVYNIKQPVQDKYSYEINFVKGNTTTEVISLKGPCDFCDPDEERIIDGKCLTTNYDMVSELCDSDGNLHYVVTISENNDVFKKFLYDFFSKEQSLSELNSPSGSGLDQVTNFMHRLRESFNININYGIENNVTGESEENENECPDVNDTFEINNRS